MASGLRRKAAALMGGTGLALLSLGLLAASPVGAAPSASRAVFVESTGPASVLPQPDTQTNQNGTNQNGTNQNGNPQNNNQPRATPELNSFVLFGAGALGLAGYALVQRTRRV